MTAQYAAGPVFPVTLTAKRQDARKRHRPARSGRGLRVICDIPSQAGGARRSRPRDGRQRPDRVHLPLGRDRRHPGLANGAGSDAASLATVLGRLTKTRVHRLVTAANSATTGADTDSDVVSDWLTQQAGPSWASTVRPSSWRRARASPRPTTSRRRSTTPAGRLPSEVRDYLPFVAAQVAAARGRGQRRHERRPLLGEKDDPAANLDGLRLRDVRVAPYESEGSTGRRSGSPFTTA